MAERKKRMICANILFVLIDVFNLAEQLAVYFIAKGNDLDETAQQRFFFILFGVGGATLFEPIFCHRVAQIIFRICIEGGELASYLTLLNNTTSLLVVSIVFFVLEVVLHGICIGCLCSCGESRFRECLAGCCTLPLRVIFYGLLFATQILFLFLDASSPFRGTFYEVLMILATFFGTFTIERSVGEACTSTTAKEGAKDDNEKIYRVWQGFIAVLGLIIDPIITITAVVYCSQMLSDRAELKTYDFVIYILTIICYGILLLSLLCGLGCCLCFCAGGLLAFLKKCLSK